MPGSSAALRRCIPVALIAVVWSCADDDPAVAPAFDVTCEGCCDVGDPVPPCERSLCATGDAASCTLTDGPDADACLIAVCAEDPSCCIDWWTDACVATVRALCPTIACGPDRCGDGYLDTDEECDDGDRDDRDGCAADCTAEVDGCGDGVVDDGEECDAGADNGGYGSFCTTACTIGGGFCGDGIVEPEEECDGGPVVYDGGDGGGSPPEEPTGVGFGAGSGTPPVPGPDAAPPPAPICDETCHWDDGDDGDDDDGDDDGDGDDGGWPTCCESVDDACGQRGDGQCQSGCAWGDDPDCEAIDDPITGEMCCADPGDPCGWSGNSVCDEGCAWADVDCAAPPPDCDAPIDPLDFAALIHCHLDTVEVPL